jgi:hypothetical protein
MWEPQTPGAIRACPGLYRDFFTCFCRCGKAAENIGNRKEDITGKWRPLPNEKLHKIHKILGGLI